VAEFEVKKIDEAERRKIVDAALDTLRRRGPDRVLVDPEGTAVPPGSIAVGADDPVDLVFVREDGWTLGVTHKRAGAAQRMFTGQWVTVLSSDEITNAPRLPSAYDVDPPDPDEEVEIVTGSIDDFRNAFKP
jgi:hypothetical protein